MNVQTWPEPPRVEQTTAKAFFFHLAGVAACLLSLAVGYVLAFIGLLFDASCDQDGSVRTDHTWMRIWFALIGLGVSTTPGMWALLARAYRFSWQGWAAVAAITAALTLLTATLGGISMETCWGNNF